MGFPVGSSILLFLAGVVAVGIAGAFFTLKQQPGYREDPDGE